ncbi:MAG TPA: Cu2+-exporting ATPase [Treponema sp.]|nr:Cu2+-exporting ATPase [Treponema sp.]
MKQYAITGMSCAACSARIEKAVSAVTGVSSCSVNLLTNSMIVDGEATSEQIISAVTNAGYGASPLGEKKGDATLAEKEELLKDKTTPVLIRTLAASLVFLFALMYFSMGHMLWNWPLPRFMQGNHVAMGLLQMILSAVVLVINRRFFTNGFKGLIHRAPNMDTLVALGSGISFAYSTVNLFIMTRAVVDGNNEKIMQCMDTLYFESAAMIVTLITVGKLLESVSKGKTTNALKSLMRLSPKTATVIRGEKEIEIAVENLQKGEIFTVRPGQTIPADGVVIEGESAVNESALTGESIPVDKAAGNPVSAATINQSGFLKCRATRVGEDTSLAEIIRMVSDAAATKAPIAKTADRISGIFVPAVIAVAAITTLIWLCLGKDIPFALSRGISVLVISCPCALGLATPVAIMVGNGKGAKNGILFKTAESLEECGRIQIVAMDKTGTLTSGHPVVTDIHPAQSVSENELLQTAADLESKSEHPLAKAVMNYAEGKKIRAKQVNSFKSLTGNGVQAELENENLLGGSIPFMERTLGDLGAISKDADKLSLEGKTPLVFAKNGKVLGIIAVADTLKDDSTQAVKELHGMGIKVVMLTGDNEKTAKAIAEKAGIDNVFAQVLPAEKDSIIKSLMKKGKVAMVGDGINDAPALTSADVGIAIGAGTDVAIDSADTVLMNSRLSDVSAAVRLSRATLRNIKQNLFWAFFYNSILIPVAAGLFSKWGLVISPMLGAAAMSLSSFCVVTNALRLNLVDIHNPRHDKKKNSFHDEITEPNAKEEKMAEKVLKVEGMMCTHCEAHVSEALKKIDGITDAVADHTKKTVTIKTTKEISSDILAKAIKDAGYEMIG